MQKLSFFSFVLQRWLISSERMQNKVTQGGRQPLCTLPEPPFRGFLEKEGEVTAQTLQTS